MSHNSKVSIFIHRDLIIDNICEVGICLNAEYEIIFKYSGSNEFLDIRLWRYVRGLGGDYLSNLDYLEESDDFNVIARKNI